jgi:hypothetical protein
MPMDEQALRDQLLELLRGGNAHADLATVVDDVPKKLRGSKPEGAPFTPWQLLEHMRITLKDLLTFSTDPEYVELKWPEEYWPAKDTPDSDDAWNTSVKALKADFAAFEKMVQNPKANLCAKIPWGEGQTLLREILIACTHTSYHLGQMAMVRKELGAWKS